jgi:putative endonuclease
MAKHNELGAAGEDVAANYLKDLDWEVIARNFRRPYGEIDIVARETAGKLVFVEVKTVKWVGNSVSYGTGTDFHRPEDNVHPQKLKRLSRTIESYLLSKKEQGDWRFDVLAVYLNPETRQAKIRHLEDIIIGT